MELMFWYITGRENICQGAELKYARLDSMFVMTRGSAEARKGL